MDFCLSVEDVVHAFRGSHRLSSIEDIVAIPMAEFGSIKLDSEETAAAVEKKCFVTTTHRQGQEPIHSRGYAWDCTNQSWPPIMIYHGRYKEVRLHSSHAFPTGHHDFGSTTCTVCTSTTITVLLLGAVFLSLSTAPKTIAVLGWRCPDAQALAVTAA